MYWYTFGSDCLSEKELTTFFYGLHNGSIVCLRHQSSVYLDIHDDSVFTSYRVGVTKWFRNKLNVSWNNDVFNAFIKTISYFLAFISFLSTQSAKNRRPLRVSLNIADYKGFTYFWISRKVCFLLYTTVLYLILVYVVF